MPLPTFEHTAVITPEQIYFTGTDIPSGYRARAFRVPVEGELYLDVFGNICRNENFRWVNTNPRLILEKIPPKASTGSTEVFRTVNYRKATREELTQNLRFYYETESGGMRLFVGEDVIGQTDIRDIFVRY